MDYVLRAWRLLNSRRQALSARLGGEWNQHQSESECNRSERDGNAERTVMADADSHQKSNSRAAEARERCGESEGARAALRGILLGQP